MKRITLLLTVLIALFVAVSPALAAPIKDVTPACTESSSWLEKLLGLCVDLSKQQTQQPAVNWNGIANDANNAGQQATQNLTQNLTQGNVVNDATNKVVPVSCGTIAKWLGMCK